MKQDGKAWVLVRLKGIAGYQINAILVASGHNLRLILNHIKKMMKENPLKLLQIVSSFLNRVLLGIYSCLGKMVLSAGIEPAASSLPMKCSTPEL